MALPQTYIVRLETQDEPGTDFEVGPFATIEDADKWRLDLVDRYERDPDFVVVCTTDNGTFTRGAAFPQGLGAPTDETLAYMDEFYGVTS